MQRIVFLPAVSAIFHALFIRRSKACCALPKRFYPDQAKLKHSFIAAGGLDNE
jgi:hypothetical protein